MHCAPSLRWWKIRLSAVVAVVASLAIGCGSVGSAFVPSPLEGPPAEGGSEIDAARGQDGAADAPVDVTVALDSSAAAEASTNVAEASTNVAPDVAVDDSSDGAPADVEASVGDGPELDVGEVGEVGEVGLDVGSEAAPGDAARPGDSAAPGDAPAASDDSSEGSLTDAAVSFTIGGTVTGLAGGAAVVLGDGHDSLTVTANGPFVFASRLTPGSTYAVSVVTQPSSPAQTCVVSAGAGAVAGNDVTGIVVNCMTGTYTIGGTMTGLGPGDTLILQDNGASTFFVVGNGPFAFGVPLPGGSPYSVTALGNPLQPIAQTCTIAMGSGTVGAANVSNVSVTCVTSTFTIGGTLSGLAPGDTVTLQDSGGDSLVLGANGAFTFPTSVLSGAAYSVTASNPSSPVPEVCTIAGGSGEVGSTNVSTVQIACAAMFTVGGTLSGLAPGETVVLQDNGGDNLPLAATGPFTFATSVLDGLGYSVTVLTNPLSPTFQICAVTSGSGLVSGASVTGVQVVCTTGQCIPATCGGTCVAGTCTFTCADPSCSSVSCPPGVPCDITCSGGGCDGELTCPPDAPCTINCSGSGCDGEISCSGPSCALVCMDSTCDGEVNLSGTSNTITCAPGSCGGQVACGGKKCTTSGVMVPCFAQTCAAD